MREKIAQYLGYRPRNKVIFTPYAPSCLTTLDVGYELSARIKDHLDSPYLPMVAEDELHALLRAGIAKDEVIGDYLAIRNWGILFEPALNLNLNLPSLFDSLSRNTALILVNCGQADADRFYLVGRNNATAFPIGGLNPYVIQ